MYKKIVIALSFILILVLGIGLFQFSSLVRTGEKEAPEPADVIIVLGAGVWETGASPAMIGRVKQAATLYQQGFAPKLIVSGGLGEFPPTEALVMQELLMNKDVPQEDILLEERATNTHENIKYSLEIMGEKGFESAIIVTDVFHLKRAMAIARKQGMSVSGIGVKETVLYTNQSLFLKYSFREVLAILWYTIRGYI